MRLSVIFCLVASLINTCAAQTIHKYALVIGIKGEGRDYADKDAIEFADLIHSEVTTLDRGRIRLLTNGSARRDSIIRAIHSIGREVDQDKASHPNNPIVVYVFISGRSEVDERADESFFLPFGVDPKLPDTGIRSDELLTMLKSYIMADRLLFFFDTDFAASAENHGYISKGSRSSDQTLNEESAVTFPKAEYLGLFSSAASQRSYEDPTLRHGIFAYFLIKGLRGEADKLPNGNGDGQITADELKSYLDGVVPKQAALQGQQTPMTSLAWNGATELFLVSSEHVVAAGSQRSSESEHLDADSSVRHFPVAHIHFYGACVGLLNVGNGKIEYESEGKHQFISPLADVARVRKGRYWQSYGILPTLHIKMRNGKNYDFFVVATNFKEMLSGSNIKTVIDIIRRAKATTIQE